MRLHTFRKLAVIKGGEIHHEIVFNGENGVRCEPRVVFGVDLRDAGFVAVFRDSQVDVCGTHGVAVQCGKEIPGRAVLREGVGCGAETVEAVFAIGVRLEFSAEVIVGLVVWVLEVVFSVRGGLPEVEGCVGDGFVGLHVADDAVHVGYDSVFGLVLDDGVAEFSPGGVGGPEGSEDGGGGGDVVGVVDLDVVGDFGDEAVILH